MATWKFGQYETNISTYPLLIAAGFLVGGYLCERDFRRHGRDPAIILEVCLAALVSCLFGSRLTYALMEFPQFWHKCMGTDLAPRPLLRILSDCAAPLRFWEGGLLYYGGFFASLLGMGWVARRRRVSYLLVLDTVVVPTSLGHAMGRLGCFAAGCCFGSPTGTTFGVRFPRESQAFLELAHDGVVSLDAASTPLLHPAQLYEVLAELILSTGMLLFRPRKRNHGEMVMIYFAGYALFRAILEVFRGDVSRKFLVPDLISTSQALSVPMFLLAVTTWWWIRRAARAELQG